MKPALYRAYRPMRVAVAALAAATLATGAVAGPAAADPDPGSVSAYLNDTSLSVGGPGKTVLLRLESTNAVDPAVTVDVAGLAGVATATFPDSCVTSGTLVTCATPSSATPDQYGFIYTPVPVLLSPATNAVAGATGTVTYTASAVGIDGYPQQATVTLADGPDLVDLVDAHVPTAATGATVSTPVIVANAGGRLVKGLRLTFTLSAGLDPAVYKNCRYGSNNGAGSRVVCDVPGRFEPGAGTRRPAVLPLPCARRRSRASESASTWSRWPAPWIRRPCWLPGVEAGISN